MPPANGSPPIGQCAVLPIPPRRIEWALLSPTPVGTRCSPLSASRGKRISMPLISTRSRPEGTGGPAEAEAKPTAGAVHRRALGQGANGKDGFQPTLDAKTSAALRDRLVHEVAGLSSAEAAA